MGATHFSAHDVATDGGSGTLGKTVPGHVLGRKLSAAMHVARGKGPAVRRHACRARTLTD